jgi:hypothetical protein
MARIKKTLNAKAVRAIRKMIAYVLAHPEELDQDQFPQGRHACDTPFCGAGHIIAVATPKLYKKLIRNATWHGCEYHAKKALGIPVDVDTTRLFGVGADWPTPFAKKYQKANALRTLKARQRAIAKVFAERWEALIESDAKDLVYPYYPSEIKEFKEAQRKEREAFRIEAESAE